MNLVDYLIPIEQYRIVYTYVYVRVCVSVWVVIVS